jgi:HK97 family phage portal protein
MRILSIDPSLKATELDALFGIDEYSRMSERTLASAVPWLYRAIDLRAMAVASMPYEIVDRSGNAVNLFGDLSPLFRNVEAALTVYGCAYLFVERSARRVLGLRWIAPQSVRPLVDSVNGLAGFERRVGGGSINLTLTLDDIVYFWRYNPHAEVAPGPSPVQAALESAGIAYNTNRFISMFFERGAIGATILAVEGNPPEADLRRLESWWRRLLSGVRNAFTAAAVRAEVKPVQVGYPLEQLDIETLFSEVRNQICAALGVPQTMMEDAANYATAAEHRRSFYTETIIPECRMIESEMNRQLLGKMGLTLTFHPERLEIFQQDETSKAGAIVDLVRNGIMTVDEARQWIGLEPFVKPEPVNDVTEIAVQRARFAELRQWREVVRRQPGREFKCEVLPPHVEQLVRLALGGGYDPFPMKAIDDEIDADISRMQREVRGVFSDFHARIAAAIAAGEAADDIIAEMRDALSGVLVRHLTDIAYRRILANSLDTVVVYEPAIINQRALEWAAQYGYDLVTQLTDTTRDVVKQAVERFISTPGMTRDDLVSLLEPAFGNVRAEMIATTEVTRAYAMATNEYQAMLAESGIEMTRVWNTNNDDRVCPICAPLDGEEEDNWPSDLRDGPPAHVNCRCTTSLRRKR